MFVTNYSYYRRLTLATVICCQGLIASESSQALMQLQAGSGLSTHTHSLQSHTSLFANIHHSAFELKQATVERWNDLPTWGKCAVAGTTATVALLGSVWAINCTRDKSETPPAKILTEGLRAALLVGAAQEEFLGHDDAAKVAALKEVFQQVIGERYKEEQQAIILNILQYRSLFTHADWFDLWKYACEYEPQVNEGDLRNWLGINLVDEMQICASDTQMIIHAWHSGVKLTTPVIILDEDSGAASSTASAGRVTTFGELYNETVARKNL